MLHGNGLQQHPKSPDHVLLGAALRALREREGLSHADVAARAELRGHHVAAIERGEVDPTFLTLVRLARAVGAPLAELLQLFEELRAADE